MCQKLDYWFGKKNNQCYTNPNRVMIDELQKTATGEWYCWKELSEMKQPLFQWQLLIDTALLELVNENAFVYRLEVIFPW